MISGMYLGDIARRVLYRIAQESDIFGDAAASLSVPFVLRYALALLQFMSSFLSAEDMMLLNPCREILSSH